MCSYDGIRAGSGSRLGGWEEAERHGLGANMEPHSVAIARDMLVSGTAGGFEHPDVANLYARIRNKGGIGPTMPLICPTGVTYVP